MAADSDNCLPCSHVPYFEHGRDNNFSSLAAVL